MSNDIKTLLTRIDNLQEAATPRQLPALFRPAKISPVLTQKKDSEHPTSGHMVGSLEEAMQSVEEDMLNRVRRDFTQYLDKLADTYSDDGQRDATSRPRDAVHAEKTRELDRLVPVKQSAGPVKTYDLDDGSMLECWGDQYQGFEIRRGQHRLPTRFRTIDDADMAVTLYQKRRRPQDPSQDYIEER